jgi:hypothetical protein
MPFNFAAAPTKHVETLSNSNLFDLNHMER